MSPEPARPSAFPPPSGASQLARPNWSGFVACRPPQVCLARLSQLPGEPVGPARTGSTSAWCFSSPLQALSESPQLIAHRALGTVKFITSGLRILKTATALHDSQPLRRTARVMRGCDTQAQCPARDSRKPQQTQALHGSLRTKDRNDVPRHCRVAPAVSVLQSTRADRRSAWRKVSSAIVSFGQGLGGAGSIRGRRCWPCHGVGIASRSRPDTHRPGAAMRVHAGRPRSGSSCPAHLHLGFVTSRGGQRPQKRSKLVAHAIGLQLRRSCRHTPASPPVSSARFIGQVHRPGSSARSVAGKVTKPR